MKKLVRVGFAALLLCAMKAPGSSPDGVALWRLDCGSIAISDLGDFSDTGMFAGQKKELTASCYLVRNGDRYLLWDSGIDGALAGKGRDKNGNGLSQKISSQLARIGVSPSAIDYVGISHIHTDHTGQVADFPDATLLIGKGDWGIVQGWQPARARFSHWLEGGGKVEQLEGDHDVFSDGSATIMRLPGHTPGHQGLLVRLKSGPVLISGDQYHFSENRNLRGVPRFNMDRADTLASHDRFEQLVANLKATVIIQHEPADIAKLPAFPAAAL
jgi:glyoxylase-like metal-dependent hydrolase (beta-lactamase superfamily II)